MSTLIRRGWMALAVPFLTLVTIGLASLSPAEAQTTVYSTFGAGSSFQGANTYNETGPSADLATQSLGAPFTVSQSGTLFSLTIAYNYFSGTKVGHLYLADDLSKLGNTGASLESFTFTNLPAESTNSFTPEVLDSVVNPTLNVGTTYYLYGLETGDTHDGFNLNDQGLNGTLVVSSNGGSYGISSFTLPAFSVQLTPAGTATPEPASYAAFVLGGLGLLGLGLKARKRSPVL